MVQSVADLSSYAVEARALKEYQERGWTILPRHVPQAAIDGLSTECDRLWSQSELFLERGTIENSSPRTDRLDPVCDISEEFSQLVGPCGQIAAQFLKATCRLVKNKLIYKPAGAVGYGLHQDFAYYQDFGFEPGDACTICVCIDSSNEASGSIEFAVGSDWSLLTPRGMVCDPPADSFEQYEPAIAHSGDVLVFSTTVPHRSGPNLSTASRRMFYLLFAVVSPALSE